MKTPKTPLVAVSYCMILCLQAVNGAEVPKLFNNIALNLPGAWSGGTVPGPGDVALWDSQFVSPVNASSALSPTGSNLSFAGIKVTDVGGNRNLGASFVGYRDANPTNTLTIGAAGIDMSAATQTFLSGSKISIGADQTWDIGDANTNASPAGLNNNEDLVFFSQAAGESFDFGGKKVTTTGVGQVSITSGYTLKNGTLDVGNNLFVIQGGSSRVTTLAADLNLVVSAGKLRLQANSGAGGVSLTSVAPVTVNGGAFELKGNGTASMIQSGKITLNDGGTFTSITDNPSPQTVSGPIVANGAVTWALNGAKPVAAGIPLQGNLSGAGDISYLNTATVPENLFILSGNNNGFTGSLAIEGSSGTRSLRLASATAGSAAATWNVAANNTLQVDGVSVQLGTLTGSGAITNSSTTSPATIQVGAGSFGGVISDGISQPVNLTKTGPGNLILTGLNTYSGATTVSAGKLTIPSDQPTPIANDYTIADGATLTVALAEADSTLSAGQIEVGNTAGATLILIRIFWLRFRRGLKGWEKFSPIPI